MNNIRYIFEYILFLAFFYLFKVLGLDRASDLGSFIGRIFGPWLKVHSVAVRNLAKAMPEISEDKREDILEKMWDNLGRYVGEFPHLLELTGDEFKKRVEVEGVEYIHEMKNSGNGAIFISGHFANWEITPKVAYENDSPLVLVYRPANNDLVNDFIIRQRKKSHDRMFIKGTEAARAVVQELKHKRSVGMLVDQKMNEGLKLKFFGRDAMTAQAAAQFAIKFGCPVIPAVTYRKKGANFKVKVFPPLEIRKSGDEKEDIKNAMQQINDLLESWVREKPEDWFWVHNRWVE